jgi:glycosyltransferase involved in cell wall biosynthesis
MSNDLKISVVICSYNRADYISGAMESLYNQTLPKNLYEIIVVDNNSTDNTKQVCENYISQHTNANFYYYEEKRQGATFARNTGAAKAQSPLLCFMDDDAVADNDFLERIVSFFQEYSDATGLGGRIIPKYIPEEPKWMSYYVSALNGNFDYSKEVTVFKPGKFPLESNMVVRTKDFFSVNGFSESILGVIGTLRVGGEAKEFFIKLQNLGKKVYYDPAIKVKHIVEVKKLTRAYRYRVASGIGRGERVRVLEISNWAFIKKVFEYIIKLGGSIILAIQYTFQGNPAKALPVIQFRIDAVKGLFNN